MRFDFTARTHEEYGTLGWLLNDTPGFDPGSGMIVAHDILEEFPGGGDGPHDELVALGCAAWLRGEGGYFAAHHYSDIATHIASDIPEILRHVLYEGYPFPAPPPAPSLTPDGEDFAERVLRLARKEWIEDDFQPDEVEPHLPKITGWLRAGYRRAQQRYRGLSQSRLCRLFRDIEEQADAHLKHAEEGDVLRVHVDPGEYDLRMEFLHAWELWECDQDSALAIAA